MADMNPIGIDQTTGQQRPVGADDSVVNNIGNSIASAVVSVGDFSGGPNPFQVIYPWSDPTRLSSPSSLPGGAVVSRLAWSPNGEYLATGNDSATALVIYQRTGTAFNRLANPSTLPGTTPRGIAWSASGEFLAIGGSTSPLLTLYQRSGSTFSPIANPTTVPASSVRGASFSPNGEFLAIGSSTAPFLYIYQRDDITFDKLADPASLPPNFINQLAFSPDGEFLATAGQSSFPKLNIYQRDGTTFTRLDEPASVPTGDLGGVTWSPDGQYLTAFSFTESPYVFVYQRDGTTFTKVTTGDTGQFTNSSDFLDGVAIDGSWSPDAQYLAVGQNTTPFIAIYSQNNNTFMRIADPATLPESNVTCPLWSPDGQFLGCGLNASPFIAIYQTSMPMPSSGILTIIGMNT